MKWWENLNKNLLSLQWFSDGWSNSMLFGNTTELELGKLFTIMFQRERDILFSLWLSVHHGNSTNNFRRFIETELMNHFLQSTMYCIFTESSVIFDNVESNTQHANDILCIWRHKQIQHRNAQQSREMYRTNESGK